MSRKRGTGTKNYTFRLTPPQFDRLCVLADLARLSRSEVLGNLVDAEYDSLEGNPRAKELLKALQEAQDLLSAAQAKYEDRDHDISWTGSLKG